MIQRLRRLSGRLLVRLPDAQFRLLLVLLLACATYLLASGLAAHAALARENAIRLAVQGASSPIPYLHPLDAVRQATDRVADSPYLWVVRVDSLPRTMVTEACTLGALVREDAAESLPTPVFLALSPEIPSCLRRSSRLVQLPRDPSFQQSLNGARTVILDPESRARYSRRDIVPVEEARTIVEAFTVSDIHGNAEGADVHA
jgi:hypothetical protein